MENTLNMEKFNPTKGELLALADEGRKLTIAGIEDVAGYAAVHQHRMKLKESRVKIAKTGKEAREEALAYQKAVIAYEKELISIIEPIEETLFIQEKAIDDEKLRVQRVALLPSRHEKLAEIGLTMTDDELMAMDVDQFADFFNQKRIDWINAKEAALKTEQEKVEADKRAIEEAQRLEEGRKEAVKHAQEAAMRDAEIAAAKAEQDKRDAVAAAEAKAEEEKAAMRQAEMQRDRERMAAEKKAADDLTANIEADRKEQEALEKEKNYKEFLEKYNYPNPNLKVERVGNEVIMWKVIDKITI